MSCDMMESWKKSSLAQICDDGLFTDGDWIESKDQDPEGKIRLIQLSDIGDGVFLNKTSRYINSLTADRLRVTYLHKGDILLARMPDPLGRCCIFPLNEKAITAVDVCIIRPANSSIDQTWLSFLLNSFEIRSQIDAQGTGTTRIRISRKRLGEIAFSCPPLHEQRRIAEILSSVDEAIAATQAVIEQTQKVKQATLERLLAKGIGHTRFKQTEIGEIPEAWELSTLVDAGVGILDGDRGKEYPKAEDYLDNGYCLFLNAKNVTRAGFVFEELQFISKEKHKKLRNGLLNPLDIVVTTRGTIGNFAFFDTEVPFNCMRINSGMAIMRSASSKLLPNFLFALLGSALIERQLARRVFGSAQPQLTLEILRKLIVPLPSEEEQFILSTKAREFGELEKRQLIELASLNNLKLSLMSDLLTGRKRVTDTLPLAAE